MTFLGGNDKLFRSLFKPLIHYTFAFPAVQEVVIKLRSYICICIFSRVQFEEMCADVLGRVEAPLHNLMEQASEYRRFAYSITLSIICVGI